MAEATPLEVLKVGNTLGEGILWDSRRQVLWWTDIQRSRLHRYDWNKRDLQVLETPDRVGSFGLVAGSDELITAFADGIALYHPLEKTVRWLARPNIEHRVRFNDGRVDRQGRFWSGTMDENEPRAPRGNLYCVDRAGDAHVRVSGVKISNALCMSPDGSKLYFADTLTRTIRVYDLIEPEGRLGTGRYFAQTPAGSVPDGSAVDADGCLWNALWGGSCVARFTPEGKIDRTIAVPARQPSCVCFGGPNLDLLFVTTAREGLDAATLSAEPHCGDVFVYRPGVQGLPESEYRL